MLTTIRTYNFKSNSNEPISLGKFNVLIGANAAGKSNFVDAIRFVHDVIQIGATRAVSSRQGWENVLTKGKRKAERISTELFYDFKDNGDTITIGGKTYILLNIRYAIEIGFTKNKGYINSEILEASFKMNGEIVEEYFKRSRNKVILRTPLTGVGEQSWPVPKQREDIPYVQTEFFSLAAIMFKDFITGWRFYELDVNAARLPCADEGENILHGDGKNLAVILDRLRAAPSKAIRERIINTMSLLIPGFESWKIVKQFDGKFCFTVLEKGIKKTFPPMSLSDGTIRLLSILLALLYQPSSAALICVDEPERYLHPQVLRSIVEIMRDVSVNTQLVVTTHSPELVKWLEPNEVLMTDKIDNMTHIVKAESVDMIEGFLKEFNLDELWLGGYLERGKAF